MLGKTLVHVRPGALRIYVLTLPFNTELPTRAHQPQGRECSPSAPTHSSQSRVCPCAGAPSPTTLPEQLGALLLTSFVRCAPGCCKLVCIVVVSSNGVGMLICRMQKASQWSRLGARLSELHWSSDPVASGCISRCFSSKSENWNGMGWKQQEVYPFGDQFDTETMDIFLDLRRTCSATMFAETEVA